jgi:hypothetical protein
LNDNPCFNEDKMKITYTQYVPDPALRGTTTNLPAHVAQVLIASGQATAAPLPRYGTTDWLTERAEMSKRAVPAPGDVDPNVKGVEWGIRDKVHTDPFSRVVVIRREGAETTFYAVPPTDAPASVVRRFEELVSGVVLSPEAEQARRERLEREQYEQQQAEKKGTLATLFGN